jgi:hypothetical protein
MAQILLGLFLKLWVSSRRREVRSLFMSGAPSAPCIFSSSQVGSQHELPGEGRGKTEIGSEIYETPQSHGLPIGLFLTWSGDSKRDR